MLKSLLKTLWCFVLEAVGERDYARYCDRQFARGETPLAPDAFYLSKLERKYSRPNRCC